MQREVGNSILGIAKIELPTFGGERDRLTAGIYIPTDSDQALGRLEKAFIQRDHAEAVFQKLKASLRSGELLNIKLDRNLDSAIAMALSANIISEAKANLHVFPNSFSYSITSGMWVEYKA